MHGEPDTEGEVVALLLDVPVELAVALSLVWPPVIRASRARVISSKGDNKRYLPLLSIPLMMRLCGRICACAAS